MIEPGPGLPRACLKQPVLSYTSRGVLLELDLSVALDTVVGDHLVDEVGRSTQARRLETCDVVGGDEEDIGRSGGTGKAHFDGLRVDAAQAAQQNELE